MNFEFESDKLSEPDGMTTVTKDLDKMHTEHEKGVKDMQSLKVKIKAKHKKIMKVLEDNAVPLMRACVEKALNGDGASLRFCIERILPPREMIEQPQFSLPSRITVDNIADVAGQVVRLVSLGHLSSKRGKEIAEILQVYSQTIEMTSTEQRLRKLEDHVENRSTDDFDLQVPLESDGFVQVTGDKRIM